MDGSKNQIFNYTINNSIINNSKIIDINQNDSSTDMNLNLDKDLIELIKYPKKINSFSVKYKLEKKDLS